MEQATSDFRMALKFYDRLFDLLTEHKKNLFTTLIEYRTNHIAWLADNFYHEQNSSAIIRSADCFGYNTVFVIEDKYRFKVNEEIAMGAQKWVNTVIFQVGNVDYGQAIHAIKQSGYKLIAATPHINGLSVENLDIRKPICIAMGSERHGHHPEILEEADGFVAIPMEGFSESLNVSVTAGVLMYTLKKRLKSEGIDWQLSDADKKRQILIWMLKTIPSAQKMVERWIQEEAN